MRQALTAKELIQKLLDTCQPDTLIFATWEGQYVPVQAKNFNMESYDLVPVMAIDVGNDS